VSDRKSVSGALAAFASGIRAENLPEDVAHQAARCLVDWFGCTIAGAATPESGRVRATIRAMDPDGSRAAGIVGTRERSTAGQAALANGIAAHVLDFDDTFNPDRTTIHGSAPLWPAIAAACELYPSPASSPSQRLSQASRCRPASRSLRTALRRRLARDRHGRAWARSRRCCSACRRADMAALGTGASRRG
jgi:2-methylcitrate dehydratase PrpD